MLQPPALVVGTAVDVVTVAGVVAPAVVVMERLVAASAASVVVVGTAAVGTGPGKCVESCCRSTY